MRTPSLSTPTERHNRRAFSALTYNILARSLGSNCIPWVMCLSQDTRARIEATTGRAFLDWRRDAVDNEYTRHWHKNFESGDYAGMRKLWSAARLASAEDVPASLGGVAFAGEDTVAYGGATARTLRGCLRASLGDAEGAALYDEVARDEAAVYDWAARGPRVLAVAARSGADIVALEEYDVHGVEAAYGGGPGQTFAAAMDAAGYDGVFAEDPLAGREPPSGLGLFWRRDAFEARDGVAAGGIRLACGDARSDCIANHDLRERWHPTSSDDGAEAELPAKDRRHAAVARLRHRATGRSVYVVAAHLMTTARDRAGITRYPGEVRAGELATIRAVVERTCEPDETLLFLGDLNTPPDEADTWRGACVAPGRAPLATGFDAGGFEWGGRRLRDAFERDHAWAAPADKCTSKNGDRTQWIDYIFYEPAELAPAAWSDMTAPPTAIPDAENPSDHLPLLCAFDWVDDPP